MKRDKCYKGLFFYLFSILISIYSFGQSNPVEFDHYTTNQGLSNDYIHAIIQDSKGFIWTGTDNGLNRFDGITFKTYYFDLNDSTSISGSGATSMVEDSLKNLWVMTSNGLCVYDRNEDNFSRKLIRVNGEEIPNSYIYACFLDSKGYLWIADANQGILRFKLHDIPDISIGIIDAEIYTIVEDDVNRNFRNNVFSFAEDKDGKIWVASQSKTLFYFDNQQNKFISQAINLPEVNRFSDKRKELIKDRDGDIFISIEDNGLVLWNQRKNKFTLFKPNGTDTGPKGNVLFALAEDKNGLIWVGDRNSEGISIFNKQTGKFAYCQSEDLDPYSLNTNKINCIYRDATGAMWVGTIVGINKYSPGKSKFRRYYGNPNLPNRLSNNNILCFAESRTGDIWIGTDGGGLNKLDRKTGRFSHYPYEPSNRHSLGSNAVISVCEDHEGTLWMGTYHGGLENLKDGQVHTYLPDPSNPNAISDRNIWYVLEDSKQNLWLGTLSSGLDLFNRETNRFYHFTPKEGDSTSLRNSSIQEIYEDSKQNLYITGNQGVSILDLKAYDFSKAPPTLKFRNLIHNEHRNSLSSNNVRCVREDNEGNIWFGTIGSGIDKLDALTGKFTNYSMKDGLPGNSVTSILVDDFNNLWLATDKGLTMFNPKTKEVVVYDKKDGLQNKSLKSWAIKTKDGEMFFGGHDGFNSFYPARIAKNKNQNIPPVVITGLEIFNKPVQIDEQFNHKVLLSGNISETRELTLTYRENYFSFDFVALDYTTPEKNNYAYMMEGFDQDWVQCGTKREANYTNLDPGEYTFRVKASNNDGVWNEKGTSIQVVILPPWWKTWWFRFIGGFAVIFLLAYLYYLRIKHFKNQKILLEKLVAQKTSELQEMNSLLMKQAEELNQTNSLLEERHKRIEMQSEELMAQQDSLIKMNIKLNDLNATKDKFFSIIAHDIKNPFNAILGFTGLLEENFKDWNDKQKLEIVNLIHSSAKNLYQLLENLLHWSRSQSGVMKFNPQKIVLKETFNNVIHLLGETADAKNIELGIMFPEEEFAVYADKDMLDAILRNLISNAIKFTNEGGKVQLSAEANEAFAVIKVTDNGVGISEEIRGQLFRIDKHTSTYGTQNESGTGLGLILIKEFVTKQGGEIGIKSSPGKGSTFYFTIPLAKEV
ncbi:MAG: two-component regulator propeller domain-containing protein [Prolixibacteraceae bacterium]